MIEAMKSLHWKVVQRGFWANGKTNLRDYLREIERFTMKGRVEAIHCPTFIAAAEKDPLAAGAQTLYDALKCPKVFARFTAAEGAGDHCEMMSPSIAPCSTGSTRFSPNRASPASNGSYGERLHCEAARSCPPKDQVASQSGRGPRRRKERCPAQSSSPW